MEPYYQDDAVTLYHGDCRAIAHWLAADVLVMDPPYGSGQLTNGGYGRKGFVIQNDNDTTLRDSILSTWGSKPVLTFGTPRLPEPPGNWEHRLVWDKVEPGMNGGPWRYTHESIFVRGPGWVRLNASSYSILRFPRSDGMGNKEREQHPHRKPVGLMRTLIAAAPQGVIVDPFAGTGSTLRAAKDEGRRAIGVEIDERFCEIAVRRLRQEVFDFGGAA